MARTITLRADSSGRLAIPRVPGYRAWGEDGTWPPRFVAIAGEDFVPERDDEVSTPPWRRRDVADEARVREAVVRIFTGEERARLAQVKQGLVAAGVPLHTASRKEPMAHWLRRASSPRGR